MIVERKAEPAEGLGSRKVVASLALKMLWQAVLILVCVAIVAVLVIGFLEGAEVAA